MPDDVEVFEFHHECDFKLNTEQCTTSIADKASDGRKDGTNHDSDNDSYYSDGDSFNNSSKDDEDCDDDESNKDYKNSDDEDDNLMKMISPKVQMTTTRAIPMVMKMSSTFLILDRWGTVLTTMFPTPKLSLLH